MTNVCDESAIDSSTVSTPQDKKIRRDAFSLLLSNRNTRFPLREKPKLTSISSDVKRQKNIDGSRLQECPACSHLVHWQLLNDHLDNSCTGPLQQDEAKRLVAPPRARLLTV